MSNRSKLLIQLAVLNAGLAGLLAMAVVFYKFGCDSTSVKTTTNSGAALTKPDQTTASAQGGSTLYRRTAPYQEPQANPMVKRTIKAHVVALDQPFMWNRLGACQPNAMVYALARDVVPTDYDPTLATELGFTKFEPGKVRMREDKRPRPLVLRANEGDLLEVEFTNLLAQPPPPLPPGKSETRYAGFHVMGLELYRDCGIANDSTWVGTNPPVDPSARQPDTDKPFPPSQGGEPGSVCAPGQTKVYKYYAKAEGTYLVHSFSADTPASSQNSQLESGLFAVVNVQPAGGEYYRSQVTRQDLELATFYIDREREKALIEVKTKLDDEQKKVLKKNKGLTAPQVAANLEAAQKAARLVVAETTAYLPVQAGVYELNPPKLVRTTMPKLVPTTMRLRVELDKQGTQQRTVPLHGISYPVYTLTTVVPSPKTDPQKRTLKTTSVVLIEPPTNKDGPKRLRLDNGQPLVNYLAVYESGSLYPSGQPISSGTPVLSMIQPAPHPVHENDPSAFELVRGDLTAIITGPNHDRWPYSSTGPMFRENPSSPDRRQPYREMTIVYHYNFQTVPAFPQVGPDAYAQMGGDFFAINYGCAGIGAEILANRLGVGPMGREDAVDLKFEEFFLSSWSCGDPAMVVDKPANADNQWVTDPSGRPPDSPTHPGLQINTTRGDLVYPKKPSQGATKAFYPDDPSNVYHSYMRDHVKFRVLNASEGITHVHHQHAHQWLHSPNSDNGQYLDSQTIVAGSGYTMEISHGGSGNLNYTVGDSIFHCHFYPHFAEGMWSLWRVHDVIEAGTKLDEKGFPDVNEDWNRVLPDGEIATGTPIPAIVPIPSLAMAPLPARVRLVERGPDKGRRVVVEAHNQPLIDLAKAIQSLFDLAKAFQPLIDLAKAFQPLIDLAKAFLPTTPPLWPLPDYRLNPGYPFFIPAIAGHRPPHPPMDFAWIEDEHGDPKLDPDTGKPMYLDGGLPRHQVTGGQIVRNQFTRWDFTKDFVELKTDQRPYKNDAKAGGLEAYKLPQNGTAVERAAMKTHSTRSRFSYMPNGDPANFILNGLPAVAGAPFAPPEVREDGTSNVNVRRYKAAVLQMDTVLNKKGWHFPQQRMLTLWEDVAPTVTGVRPPQPFFFRSNTDDTIEFWHTNLVPNYYEMDDFQVRTPTDILGQHIHLVKFDVTASDGAGNGFNYEDGTFSPREVRERIAAINANGGLLPFDEATQYAGKGQRETLLVKQLETWYPADPKKDPSTEKNPSTESVFGKAPPDQNWDGAQTTIQRFDTDPTLNNDGLDRTVRSVFTHDHFSPSTHQQAGYYAALLVEPADSTWTMPVMKSEIDGSTTVIYEKGGSRPDGGPTGWQANIRMVDPAQSYREFAFEFQDMQLAYLANSTPTLREPWKVPSTYILSLGPAAQAELASLPKAGTILPNGNIWTEFDKGGIKLSSSAHLVTPTAPYRFQIKDPMAAAPVDGYPIDHTFSVYKLLIGNPLFPLNAAARKELLTIIATPDGKIPSASTNPVRSNLLNNGIQLSRDDATLKRGTPPFTFEIDDVRAIDRDGHSMVARYPIDGAGNLYTPDMKGWSDPPNAVAPPNLKGSQKPTPQLISFGTVGTYSVNYRNEPLPLRVATAVTGMPESTDMAYAYASIERGDADLKVQPKSFAMDGNLAPLLVADKPVADQIRPYFSRAGITLPPTAKVAVVSPDSEWTVRNVARLTDTKYTIKKLTFGKTSNLYVFTNIPGSDRVFPSPIVPLSDEANDGGVTGHDPFTPMMRAYVDDRIQVRALAGAHMNEHSFSIHGVNFHFEPSSANSGYLSTHAISLSEHFEMEFTVPARSTDQKNDFADYLYAPSDNAQGQTSGTWGILRAFDGAKGDLGKKDSSVYLAPLDTDRPKYTAPGRIDFKARFERAKKRFERGEIKKKQHQEYTVIATTAAQILGDKTLYYNTRGQATNNFPFKSEKASTTKLENPYALVYVDQDDLENPEYPKYAKLKSDMRVEPLILRANAGDWIKITLKNYFDHSALTFQGEVNPKKVGDPDNISSFDAGNPFLKLGKTSAKVHPLHTSALVGLHPQLIAYDITASDGMNVGYNSWDFTRPKTENRLAPETIEPGKSIEPGKGKELYWYAGNLSFDENDNLVETPVEFGSVNLAPADPLIQHRKGLIGALIVEPFGSSWPKIHNELEKAPEYQYVYDRNSGTVASVLATDKERKRTRAMATVTKADSTTKFDELVLVMQTDAYMYDRSGTSNGPPKFTQGAALNFRTEPLGYRYATPPPADIFPPPSPAGTAARLSNALVHPDPARRPLKFPLIYADPQTPVLTVKAGTPVRLRWIYPAGPGGDAGGSSQVPVVHGHVFQEEPYINDSTALGFNPLSEWTGGRFILPGQTVDMLFPYAGGSFQVPGDYFYGTFIGQTTDVASGMTQATWGLIRVTQ